MLAFGRREDHGRLPVADQLDGLGRTRSAGGPWQLPLLYLLTPRVPAL
jgi:hypothetical protein